MSIGPFDKGTQPGQPAFGPVVSDSNPKTQATVELPPILLQAPCADAANEHAAMHMVSSTTFFSTFNLLVDFLVLIDSSWESVSLRVCFFDAGRVIRLHP